MSLLTNLKLNYITNQLKQVENTTANSDTINAVIKYINDNLDKFDPTIDITKLNAYVGTYLTSNATLFKGAKGDPPSQADISTALADYFNKKTDVAFINASFIKITGIDTQLFCGSTALNNNLKKQIDTNDLTTNVLGCNTVKIDTLDKNHNNNILVKSSLDMSANDITNCGVFRCNSIDTIVSKLTCGKTTLNNNSTTTIDANDLITNALASNTIKLDTLDKNHNSNILFKAGIDLSGNDILNGGFVYGKNSLNYDIAHMWAGIPYQLSKVNIVEVGSVVTLPTNYSDNGYWFYIVNVQLTSVTVRYPDFAVPLLSFSAITLQPGGSAQFMTYVNRYLLLSKS